MSITMEQLRACRTLMREIEAIERYQSRIGGIGRQVSSTAFAGIYYDGGNMRESAAFQELDKVEKLYRGKVVEYARVVFAVEQALTDLPPVQREIMRLRYIVGDRWGEIACATNYTREQCRRIHNKALERICAA